ncbi:hypothetical protein [Streptomyces blastmyceticus]|uniref:Uncharacterized protein n=1 Tax=Streptomyces blastmyceticus TaxID=68180 RepID=A0ABN0WN22_9ACTN
MPDDLAGHLRSGHIVDNLPVSLPSWCVTTSEPDIAKAVSRLMGGQPERRRTDGGDCLEILTDTDKVMIVVDTPTAVSSEMRLWKSSQLVHHCDGAEFLSPTDRRGTPCGCPPTFAERKAAAMEFRGPQPNSAITFRLADDAALGFFFYRSTSWKLAESIQSVTAAIERIGRRALAELGMELVTCTTRSGTRVSYRKPVIKVLGPWHEAASG